MCIWRSDGQEPFVSPFDSYSVRHFMSPFTFLLTCKLLRLAVVITFCGKGINAWVNLMRLFSGLIG